MPITGFLKIDDIPGESRRVDHEDEIDVFGVSWEIEQATATRSGRVRARADMGPLVVHKYYDASSPYLARATEQGRAFPEMVLSLRKDSGEAHLDYLVITMENCLVASYRFANDDPSHPDGLIVERVEIDFETVKLIYTVQADDHSAGDVHEVDLGGSARATTLRGLTAR